MGSDLDAMPSIGVGGSGKHLVRTEVVQFLSLAFAKIYEHELYSPSGESSLSEERGNPDC